MSALLIPLVLLGACTDYGFAEKSAHDGSDGDTASNGAGTGQDSTGDDAGTASMTLTDAQCYDPGTAYEQQPAAGLVVSRADLDVSVSFIGSLADYTSELWVWEPTRTLVGTAHETPSGTTVSLGHLPKGTELEFAIVITDNGNTFYSGPADRNADGFMHAAVTYIGDCVWVVGFEDQEGGGDQDFNDIQLTINGPLELVPVE